MWEVLIDISRFIKTIFSINKHEPFFSGVADKADEEIFRKWIRQTIEIAERRDFMGQEEEEEEKKEDEEKEKEKDGEGEKARTLWSDKMKMKMKF